MATTSEIQIEMHPAGTAGLNDIINANWERLDEIFQASLGSGDSAYEAFAKAFLRDTLSSMENGETVVYDGSKFSRRPPLTTLAYAASVPIAFASGAAAPTMTISLTGDITFTTSDIAAGQQIDLIVNSDASIRTLTFPGGWTFMGAAAPANIAATKTGVLRLRATTTADAGIIAEWTVEP